MRNVYIVDGARTPFLKAKGVPGPFSAADLAVNAGKILMGRQPFTPNALDEVILGCVIQPADEANPARVTALRLGCGKSVPAWTVQRNCASGMQSVDCAAKDIATGRADLVLAGGTEAMSRAPLLFNDEMVAWFAKLNSARDFKEKFNAYVSIKPRYMKPIISLLKGLSDPIVNLNMGQTAENIAYQFNISREQMDQFSLTSHQRAIMGMEKNYFAEIETLFANNGAFYTADDGVRKDSAMDKLAKLKPIFDKKFGTVTAGNSSQVTDGAALLILASEEAIKKYRLPVIAKIIDTEWAGLDPAVMGLGPVYASHQLLKRFNLSLNAIDYWEINEAFAAQVLGCTEAFADAEFCRKNLGADGALGQIDPARLNVDGGAIAMGHPVGASGARIVFHLAEVLKRNQAKYGIATICIGGGQGGAMLIENVNSTT